MSDSNAPASTDLDFDVVVVGAGFAGLYLLKRLRDAGFRAVVLEAADGVGGTWYWNRYPGARCDIQSIDYSYSWDPELQDEWQWSEKYATQPEILRYVNHVADKHDLKRDIRFETPVESARWDDDAKAWIIRTGSGGEVSCRWYVMATGCLSMPKAPDIEGAGRFAGEVYYTSRWPHEGVDFTGKRVGVIGTGSSGIQSIPIIAQQAEQLTVFQRTPNFSFPAHNGAIPEDTKASFEADPEAYREEARWSGIGVPAERPEETAAMLDEAERQRRLEQMWQRGELVAIGSAFSDALANPSANEILAEFVRDKIRSIVDDPDTAELLCPTDHPVGTKRPCLDTNYYATYNLPHVRLIDLRSTPIETITETGIETGGHGGETFEFDAIVYATGFDAMTGAIVNVDITGRDGLTIADKWAHGPETYLGLMSVGFPNLFMITGPQSPSVLSNMMVSIEQHVDWIMDALDHSRSEGFEAMEPTQTAESAWVQHNNDWANITLYPHANSWYMGANVPGKPRVFLPYVGGVGRYRQVCDDVIAQGWLGFRFSDGRTECNDGVIRRLQPDVEVMLDTMEELGLPTMDTMSPEDARAFNQAMGAQRPQGPEVGEIVDGELPGPDGPLPYRLYRPVTPGPHPVVAYFHGGGWVIGDQQSDDPLCRYLCDRSGAVIVSVGYRHAPEHPFPAPVDDAFAAANWIAEHPAELGGIPGELAVAGWSAGANLAAVVCQLAEHAGAPHLSGQVLICPVTDLDTSRPSYTENGDGYLLTRALMEWFRDHYIGGLDAIGVGRSPPRSAQGRAGRPAAGHGGHL